jgi:hypothetical protein
MPGCARRGLRLALDVSARRYGFYTMNEDSELAWAVEPPEELRRQILSHIQIAAEEVRAAHGSIDLVCPPAPPELAAAVRAAIAAVKSAQAAPVPIIGGGSLRLPRMGVSGRAAVKDRRSGLAGLSEAQIIFLVLVWLFAFVLPVLGPELPPKMHAVLSDSYATFALALAITWRMRDQNK